MDEITYLTKEGFENLQNKLNKLIHEERPHIAQMIAEAREKGDYQKMLNMTLLKMHRLI